MNDLNYMRQRDLYDPEKHGGQVTMIGCGGIGSVAAIALAKLGVPRMVLIDPDVVEPHNLPNQMFNRNQLYAPKVEALAEQLVAMRGEGIDLDLFPLAVSEKGPEDWRPQGIVVSALDSMEARAVVWARVKRQVNVSLYLDARMGGGRVVLYAVDPNSGPSINRYSETFYSDEEAAEDPCTGRAIIDVGFSAAALITRAVRMHLTGEQIEPVIIHNQQTYLSVKAEIEGLPV